MSPTPPSPSRRSPLVRGGHPKRYPLATIEQGPAILRRLDAFLYLTNDQIEQLLFAAGTTATGKPRAAKGAAYAANTALRRLFDAGSIDRVPVFLPGRRTGTVKAHYVNTLSFQGARVAAELLRAEGSTPRWRRALLPRPWQPLLHGYWVREFAVRAEAACAAPGWRWWNWLDDRQLAALKAERGARYRTVPDGFAMITNGGSGQHYPHFVEIDLGTETVAALSPTRPDWRAKVESYLAYLGDDFREQFGVSTLPLVLTVTTSERRLAHLLAATAAVGGGGRFWFTTLDRLLDTPPNAAGSVAAAGLEGAFWAPIWRVPGSARARSLAARCGAQGAVGGGVSRGEG